MVGIAAPMMRASRAPKKTAKRAATSTRIRDFLVNSTGSDREFLTRRSSVPVPLPFIERGAHTGFSEKSFQKRPKDLIYQLSFQRSALSCQKSEKQNQQP